MVWRALIRLAILLLAAVPASMRADVALLVEEPAGRLGNISPTGHISLYLSRVCADSPAHLRRCRPGETGVVVGRYDHADAYDWAAMPLVPYLYAVQTPREIPPVASSRTVARLRDSYRRAYLEEYVPDRPDGRAPRGQWGQLLGAAYERRIFVYEVRTSPEQDDRVIRELNLHVGRDHFNFLFANCAGFAQHVLNIYFPRSVHRSVTRDFGLATPKQTARSFLAYAGRHPELHLSTFIIPQVPGTRRSGRLCNIVEALLTEKQYAVPLAIFEPIATGAAFGMYLATGRFNPGRNAVVLNRDDEFSALIENSSPERAVTPLRAGMRQISASARACSEAGAELSCPASHPATE